MQVPRPQLKNWLLVSMWVEKGANWRLCDRGRVSGQVVGMQEGELGLTEVTIWCLWVASRYWSVGPMPCCQCWRLECPKASFHWMWTYLQLPLHLLFRYIIRTGLWSELWGVIKFLPAGCVIGCSIMGIVWGDRLGIIVPSGLPIWFIHKVPEDSGSLDLFGAFLSRLLSLDCVLVQFV